MRILVLNRVSDRRARYAQGIDHNEHDVTYVATPEQMAKLPASVPGTRIERPGVGDAVAEVLAAIADRPKPDLVISLSELDLMDAAQLREALGVPGNREADVLLLRDKVVMKAAVQQAGLLVPQFRPLSQALNVASRIPWAGPTVLKPRQGLASMDVTVFDTATAAVTAVRCGGLPCGSGPEDFEIEEFVEGPVIHVDGLAVDGAPVAIQASRYIGTCLNFAQGAPLGNLQVNTTEAITDWTTRCLSAVGIRTGIFHLEAIDTTNGPVFLEIAGRFGGGSIVDTFELATGVHLPSALLKVLTAGNHRGAVVVRRPNAAGRYASFVWPGHHLGTDHCHITGEREFRDHPLVQSWTQRDSAEPIALEVTYEEDRTPLSGVIGPGSEHDLEQLMQRMFRSISIEGRTTGGPDALGK